MTTELQSKLMVWLQQSGHALEMRVAQEFRRAGLLAIPAEYYEDRQTGQLREIDVLAWRKGEISSKSFSVAVVIECKRSPDKPWVLLSRHHGFSVQALVQQQIASLWGTTVLEKLASKSIVENLVLFRPDEPLGYSLLAGLTEKRNAVDPAYGALRGVGTACESILGRLSRDVPRAAILALPLIVLEGVLYRAWLEEGGEMELEECEHALLAWRHFHKGGHSFVRILTESGLKGLLPRLAADIATLEKEGQVVLGAL